MATFEDFSEAVVTHLAPVEQLSPFKVGQVLKLISDADAQLGKTLAPAFAVVQVLFLLGFVGYFVVALVALVLDAGAMDEVCAEQTWVWLYVLIVLVVPTAIGFVLSIAQAGVRMVFKDATALRTADMVLAIPSPLIMVFLGVTGLALWGGMEDACADFYWANFGMLLVVFYIQIVLMCVAALLGLLALCAMGIGLLNSSVGGGEGDNGDPKYV